MYMYIQVHCTYKYVYNVQCINMYMTNKKGKKKPMFTFEVKNEE